jgi:hypothetical protein
MTAPCPPALTHPNSVQVAYGPHIIALWHDPGLIPAAGLELNIYMGTYCSSGRSPATTLDSSPPPCFPQLPKSLHSSKICHCMPMNCGVEQGCCSTYLLKMLWLVASWLLLARRMHRRPARLSGTGHVPLPMQPCCQSSCSPALRQPCGPIQVDGGEWGRWRLAG